MPKRRRKHTSRRLRGVRQLTRTFAATGGYAVSNGATVTITASNNGYTVRGVNPSITTGPTGCSVQSGTDAATPALDGKITCPELVILVCPDGLIFKTVAEPKARSTRPATCCRPERSEGPPNC